MPLVVVSDSKSHSFATIENEYAKLWIKMLTPGSQRVVDSVFAENNKDYIEALHHEDILIDMSRDIECQETQPMKPPKPIQIGGKVTRKDLEYQELEEKVKQVAEEQGKLWTFFWETTYNCNEKCIHCFNPGASHHEDEKSQRNTKRIDRSRIISLLDELRQLGVFRIVFSGGEILVSNDWEFLLSEANSRAFELHVYTNGVLLDDRNMRSLAKCWPQSVSISIYSTNPKTHDAITRTPFSHEYSIKALRDLYDAGIKTTIKSPIMKQTSAELDDLARLAESLGARISFDTMISAGNDGNLYPTSHNLTWDQLLVLALNQLSPTYVGDRSRSFGKISKDPQSPVCGAGRSIMSMAPDGRIMPCCALPIEVGDVSYESMTSIWEQAIAANNTMRLGQVRDDHKKINKLEDWRSVMLQDYLECGKHERCAWCHKCPGAALNETSDVYLPSEVQCRIASSRMVIAEQLENGRSENEIMDLISNNQIQQPLLHYHVYTPRNC